MGLTNDRGVRIISCNGCYGHGYKRPGGKLDKSQPCKLCNGTGKQEVRNLGGPRGSGCPDCECPPEEHTSEGCVHCRCKRTPEGMLAKTPKCFNCSRCKIQSGDKMLKERIVQLGVKSALFAFFRAVDAAGKIFQIEPERLKGKFFATCKKNNWEGCVANPRDLFSSTFKVYAEDCWDFDEVAPPICSFADCTDDAVVWSESSQSFTCKRHADMDFLPPALNNYPDALPAEKQAREIAVDVAPELQSIMENHDVDTTDTSQGQLDYEM